MKFRLKGSGNRKFFNNLRHFGGTRNIAISALSLSAFCPLLLLAFAAAAFMVFFKSHNTTYGAAAVSSSLLGIGIIAKGKIMHAVMYTALAVGLATAAPAQANQMTPEQLNAVQRQIVLNNSVEMRQRIYSQAVNPATQNGAVVIPLKGVGLCKRLRVIVSGTVQNTDAAIDAVATPYGIQNLFSNIQFQDLNSLVRINTHGPHLHMLNTMKSRWPFGSALQTADWNGTAPLQSMAGQFGANFPALVGVNALVHGTNKAVRMVYDVPLAYSDTDLRGAIYLNVLNAAANLSLTINPQAFVATAADDTFAVLRSGTCSFLGNLNISVYQVYLDQLQQGQGGPLLPTLDVSTVYELKHSVIKGMTATQDFPIPYTNFRDFLSTFAIYNNTGSNDGHGIGADINYWALQSANLTNIFNEDPLTVAQNARDIIGTDLPSGTYYFSHRNKPLSTVQYGNMALVLNPITAGAAAYVDVCWEDFGLVNLLTQAGSLAGGAA